MDTSWYWHRICFPAPAGATAPEGLRCGLRLSSQWRVQLLTPWAEQSAPASCWDWTREILALPVCVLGWGFLLPSKWDAVGGQQSTWHQRWQKGNWIFSKTQSWGLNLQLYRGEGQAGSLLFCDVWHRKLMTSDNGKNSPSLLADLHPYNMLSAYIADEKQEVLSNKSSEPVQCNSTRRN